MKAETAATPPPSSGTEKIADLSSDNDSFYYAIAGRPFVRFDVHAFERNVSFFSH